MDSSQMDESLVDSADSHREREHESADADRDSGPGPDGGAGDADRGVGTVSVAPADANRHLLELLDLSVDAVISTDEEHRMTLFNRGAQRMFGYEESEALGRPVSVLMPDRFRERYVEYVREFAASPERSRMMGERGQIFGLRKSGEEFPAEASISKLTSDSGQIFSVVVRDVSNRVEGEARLREAEARWHRMADALPIVFSLVDAEERYVFVNRTYEEWFGRSRHEVVGRRIEETVEEATYRDIGSRFGGALAGARQRFHLGVDSADGRRRVLDVMYAPQRGQGRVTGFFVAAVDVTERARVEERLRRRGEAIRSLHRIGSHPSLTLDEKIDGLLTLGCGQFELDLGVFARVATERWTVWRVQPASPTIAPGDAFPLAGTLCAQAVEGTGPVDYHVAAGEERSEHYPAYPDEPLGAYLGVPVEVAGQTYGVLSFTSPRPGHDGFDPFDRDLIQLMAYWLGTEIEREQAFRSQAFLAASGRALAASLDRKEILERLVDLALPALGDGCIVYTLASDGTVTRVHGGHVDSELDAVLTGLSAGTIEAGSEPHPVLAALRRGEPIRESRGGDAQDRRFFLADAAWEGLPLETCASLLVVPVRVGRKVLGAVAFFASEAERYTDMDATTAFEFTGRCASALENASLLEDAREAVRTREEVLSFVSHDLGSPLSSISMSLEYVMRLWREGDGSRKVRTYLDGMQEAADRMHRLIEDLLEVRTLDDGRAVSHSEVEAGVLVEAAVREMRPRFEAGSLDWKVAASTDATVRGDRNRLLRVLVNLLDNAVKFTEPGGRVEVGAEREGEDMVRFFVSDTGKGISKERLPRIFDRYGHTVDERRAGAGLGLAIVKKTVEMYGGRVWAESEPGSGSTFHFTVPRP